MVFNMRIAPGLARARTGLLVLSLAGLLGACASLTPGDPAPTQFHMPTTASMTSPNPATASPAAPRLAGPGGTTAANAPGPRYKVGAPYQAGGVWYVPAEQPTYDEVGLASWYGDAFDGKPTANGEVFDMHAISAAHATLPMPCMVEVTNLENGRVLQVRMNDRGPFHPGRIIDMSHAAAQQLGFDIKGTTKVRVRYIGPAPLTGVAAPVTLAEASPIAPFTRPPHPIPTYQIVPPTRAALASTKPSGAMDRAPIMGGGYVVQAGAYASRTAAERAATRLASAGTTAVKPLDRGGATLYRVLVGPWSDTQAATVAKGRVMALGFNDARVSAAS